MNTMPGYAAYFPKTARRGFPKSVFPIAIAAFLAGGYSERNETTLGAIQDASSDAKALSLSIASTAMSMAKPILSDASALQNSGGTHSVLDDVGQVLNACRQDVSGCQHAFNARFPGTYGVATAWSNTVLGWYASLTRALRQSNTR